MNMNNSLVLGGIFVAALAMSYPTRAQLAPGGLYVGYYYEDPVSNPEDPSPGALYLNLPDANSNFAGSMFFTYLGCQASSVGSISGSKAGPLLSGRWAGPVDNTLQAGSFSGTYDTPSQRYGGTYAVDAGKQFVDLRPCTQYYIAPNGTWELFPLGAHFPESFIVRLSGSRMSWPATPGSVLTLLSIIDTVNATSTGAVNAVKWQTLLYTPATTFDLSLVEQPLGQNDVVTVATFDAMGHRLAFGSNAVGTTSVGHNYQGLWWNPSESGWGINFAHQADVIFATWFTYDVHKNPWWLTMTATKTADGVYTGAVFQTSGPAFSAVPFSPSGVSSTSVGEATIAFTDASNGTFAYSVNGVGQTKKITRQIFGTLPTCVWGAQTNLSLATNYQDLWWNPAESGWGVNLTHQGNTIFATWFTYDDNGAPLWLSATAARMAAGVYSGDLYETGGTTFSAFDPNAVSRNPVGALTLTFLNGNTATFAYTVKLPFKTTVVQQKTITRQVFREPGTVCQ